MLTLLRRAAIAVLAFALTLLIVDRAIGLIVGGVVKPVNALGMEAGLNELGTRLRPGFVGRFTTAEFSISIAIDPRTGLRAPAHELGARPRVLALGDSFTFGQGVEAQEAWPALLGALRGDLNPADVVNAGWAAPSPVGQLRYLEGHASRFDPDLVVVAVFVGNDVIDDLAESVGLERTIDQLEFQARFVPALQPRVGVLGRVREALDGAFPNIYELTTLAIVRTQYLLGGHRGIFDVMLQDPPPADIEAGWSYTLSAIERIDLHMVSRGRAAAFVIVPFLDQVVARDARPGVTVDLPQRRVIRHCERARLRCLDLLPALRAFERPAQLYFTKDGHWTPLGHQVVAREIAGWLDRERMWPAAK